MVSATVKKIGGSYSLIIPASLVRELQLFSGSEVEVTLTKKRKSYFGVLKGMPKWDRVKDRVEDRF